MISEGSGSFSCMAIWKSFMAFITWLRRKLIMVAASVPPPVMRIEGMLM